jgi:predicted DNA-binding protein (MmcQ/YjbR family)
MDAERLRAYLLTLPHVVETMQWGANLVFWVGDKAIGGKMFALIDLDDPVLGNAGPSRRRVVHHAVMMYAAGPKRYSELLELKGVIPAPYLARAHWVAVERWDAFGMREWERELRAAHEIVLEKLPPKTRKALALPKAELRRAVAAGRKVLAGQAKS